MKLAIYQRKSGPEEEEMDSSELAKKSDSTGGMTSISTDVNICYRLRSRTIFDCKNHETHISENNISVIKESALVKTNYNAQTSNPFRNIPTEGFARKAAKKVDTFTQQQQTSTYITDSINDRFMCEPSIMMLPNEILTEIFSYLNTIELSTSVALVCKHWHQIAYSPILWRKLWFDGDRVCTHCIKKMLTKFPHLRELIISNR